MAKLDRNPTVFCMSVTPFTTDDRVDEQGLRGHLRRLVAVGCGVYLGSGGSGEGHALSLEELEKLYSIGVEECKGKVPTYANPREARSAKQMLEVCHIAHKAGIEVVQLYPLDGGHGMKPTVAEQELYYRDLLDNISYPVSVSIHPMAVGYTTPPPLIEKLVRDYKQIVALNVMAGQPMSVFVQFRDKAWAVRPSIKLYTSMSSVLECMMQGASGCLATEPNIAPRLSKQVLDLFMAGELERAGETMNHLLRLNSMLGRISPTAGPARGIKAAMQVLGVPGGNGNLRRPYLPLPEKERNEIAAELEAMGLKKLEGLP